MLAHWRGMRERSTIESSIFNVNGNSLSGPLIIETVSRKGPRVGLFEAGLRLPRVSAKFELRYESLKKQIQFNSLCLQFDDWIL